MEDYAVSSVGDVKTGIQPVRGMLSSVGVRGSLRKVTVRPDSPKTFHKKMIEKFLGFVNPAFKKGLRGVQG